MDDEITALREALAYDPETGVLRWTKRPSPQATRVKPGAEAGCFDGNGYRTLRFRRKQYLGHRVAWALMHGKWPQGEIDHRDGDPSNNRLSNLRECAHFQNAANQLQPVGCSGLRGAVWNKSAGKWQAQIKVRGRIAHIGLFNSPEEAAAAYWTRKHAECGEFTKVAP